MGRNGPTMRDVQKEQTKAAIRKAGRTVFMRDGYEKAGLREIAALAGISTGGIFAHFDDKPAVWRHCMDRSPPDERVRLWLTNLAATTDPKAGLAAELLVDLYGART